jgi:DNA polymerase-3 subunit alpha
VRDGEKQTTPIGRGRGYRYGLPNQEYYFKSGEMKQLLQICRKRFRIFRGLWIRLKFSIWLVVLPKFEIQLNLIILKTPLMAGEVKMRI